MAGANSRNYNYVGGVGGALGLVRLFFDEAAFAAGAQAAAIKQGGEGGWVAAFGYQPPAYIGQIAREKQPSVWQCLWLAPEVDEFRRGCEGEGFDRTARGEFGHQYGKDRYTYFEPAYALGTSGKHYSSQDRILVADIASRKDLASISFQINSRHALDAPGEFLDFLSRSHLQTGAAAVQDRNRALMIYSLTLPQESQAQLRIVAPLLLLPANADEIWINGKPADRRPGPHGLSAQDVLYLQEGGVYASLRFVEAAGGFAGYEPTYHYRLDGKHELKAKSEEGRRLRTFAVGAMCCVLYSGPEQAVTGANVRGGFVVEMGTAKEYPTLGAFREHIETQTGVSENFNDGVWDVCYRSGAHEISITKDLPRDLVLDKRVDGARVAPPVHATTFSRLDNGVLTISWKGVERVIDLR